MIQSKEEYIRELRKQLPKSINSEEVICEYENHFYYEMENGKSVEEIIRNLGEPHLIANLYKVESVSPRSAILHIFVGCNSFIFGVGIILTLVKHMFEIAAINSIWEFIAGNSLLIITLYTLFWVLLGYEIGKAYGYGGKQHLSKTVMACILPNIVLMLGTLLNVFPGYWFEPILTPSFIFLCAVVTVLFYPISKVGYKLGIHQSI